MVLLQLCMRGKTNLRKNQYSLLDILEFQQTLPVYSRTIIIEKAPEPNLSDLFLKLFTSNFS